MPKQPLSTHSIKRITRTPEQKSDLEGWWEHSDEEFFGAGACHILAGAFLATYPSANFCAVMIKPANNLPGTHIIVTDGTVAFDCRGWNDYDRFLRLYKEVWRAVHPEWAYNLVDIDDPVSWAFCRAYLHRHPSQFIHDPVPRAQKFIEQFGDL